MIMLQDSNSFSATISTSEDVAELTDDLNQLSTGKQQDRNPFSDKNFKDTFSMPALMDMTGTDFDLRGQTELYCEF